MSAPALIGREEELAAIEAFLDGAGRGSLLITGEPGIGKTVLWEAGVEAALRRSRRVLAHGAVEAEAKLAFTALSDLVGGAIEEALPALSPPRRRALEVALLLSEPGVEPPDPRAIALAFLDVLRAFAASAPVLVAVDDLQWVDSASAQALHFAARRLGEAPVAMLATARTG
ncbi:MAG TPA: ATP-binding protein, partial [Gaiellaceae bacterium]|nr:ATP-binding protein [Gaiellaceae bacterium]